MTENAQHTPEQLEAIEAMKNEFFTNTDLANTAIEMPDLVIQFTESTIVLETVLFGGLVHHEATASDGWRKAWPLFMQKVNDAYLTHCWQFNYTVSVVSLLAEDFDGDMTFTGPSTAAREAHALRSVVESLGLAAPHFKRALRMLDQGREGEEIAVTLPPEPVDIGLTIGVKDQALFVRFDERLRDSSDEETANACAAADRLRTLITSATRLCTMFERLQLDTAHDLFSGEDE